MLFRSKLVTVTAYGDGQARNYTQYYYDALGNTRRMYTGLTSPLTINGLDSVSGGSAGYATTKYAYNGLSQLTSVTDALDQTESYVNNINGNVTQKTDRNNAVTTYGYDNMGRPTSTTAGGETITNTYALTGLVRSEANSAVTTLYTYDALGRMKKETTGSTVKDYDYNIGDTRTMLKITVNNTQRMNTTYTYDALKRLKTVTEGGALQATYYYDANGNRDYVQYSNGLRTDYAYNFANMVTALTNKNSSGTTLSGYTYTYGLDGNQRTKTDNTGKVTAYVYDRFGRLSSETESVNNTQTQSYGYTYDPRHNRSTMTAAGADAYVTNYTYDLNNRLLTETKTVGAADEITRYNYDPNGNQVGKTSESLSSGSNSAGFALVQGLASAEINRYNGFNQLIETRADGVTAGYSYYPGGLRATKTAGGVTTSFILDGGNVALEIVGSAVTAKYVRGMNLINSTIGGVTNWYLYNAHGDVVKLTNSSGTVTKTYAYDAFGVEKNPDPNDANNFRYAGEYFDKETGTYYLRARYYDPTTGRFSAEDPIRSGLNWYTYCGGNPVAFVDPWGLERIVVSGGVYNFGKQQSGKFYFEFIEPALKQIREWDSSEQVTWFISNAGWTQRDIYDFHAAVASMEWISIVMMDDITQLTNYINSKDTANSALSTARTEDQITAFSVFSHGLPANDGTIALGLGFSGSSSLEMTKNHIALLDSGAFGSGVVSFLGACNPGTSYGNSFAQDWANKTGGITYAFVGKSGFEHINVGPTNIFSAMAHRSGRFYYGGSKNYPIAGTSPIPSGPSKGESPYIGTFRPPLRGH